MSKLGLESWSTLPRRLEGSEWWSSTGTTCGGSGWSTRHKSCSSGALGLPAIMLEKEGNLVRGCSSSALGAVKKSWNLFLKIRIIHDNITIIKFVKLINLTKKIWKLTSHDWCGCWDGISNDLVGVHYGFGNLFGGGMILGRHVTIVLIDSMQMQPINFTIAVV